VRRERGSVTIVLASVMVVALVLTLGAADLAKVLVVRTRVRWAADAAALAAAQELALSGSDPAAQAASLAERNDARLVACVCPRGGLEAVVKVRMPVGHLLLLPGDRWASARARAVVEAPSASAASVRIGEETPV
jgi:secretion/DNA translocation related TadE-like protein